MIQYSLCAAAEKKNIEINIIFDIKRSPNNPTWKSTSIILYYVYALSTHMCIKSVPTFQYKKKNWFFAINLKETRI